MTGFISDAVRAVSVDLVSIDQLHHNFSPVIYHLTHLTYFHRISSPHDMLQTPPTNTMPKIQTIAHTNLPPTPPYSRPAPFIALGSAPTVAPMPTSSPRLEPKLPEPEEPSPLPLPHPPDDNAASPELSPPRRGNMSSLGVTTSVEYRERGGQEKLCCILDQVFIDSSASGDITKAISLSTRP